MPILPSSQPDLIVRDLGLQAYQATWDKMRQFTDDRDNATTDEIWLLEHSPVFTQGLAGKPEHVFHTHHIPVVQTDRGGQVTYHGPGQLVVYVLLNLKRKQYHARTLVRNLEETVIALLSAYQIKANTQVGAPGIYVGQEKICSIGLRIRKGCSYHGIAFNIDMDLTPFSYINPCGNQGLQMTQLKSHISSCDFENVKNQLITTFVKNFGYAHPE